MLEDFIKTYPKSKYFTEANSLLKIIKDEQDNEAWKSAEKDALEKKHHSAIGCLP
ncbi:MAG: hypothetical protein IPO26_20050 [Saprospiraceae bacterium]|nr:hypothetical protein [Saprospiraceae bacterium]